MPKIDDAPWPQFPADLMSIALVVATQAQGTVLIHEKMFESRLYFVDKLIGMGAKIILCDPHRAVIVGPSPLHGQELSSPDIRAGHGAADRGAGCARAPAPSPTSGRSTAATSRSTASCGASARISSG